jgi:hypothetical protein
VRSGVRARTLRRFGRTRTQEQIDWPSRVSLATHPFGRRLWMHIGKDVLKDGSPVKDGAVLSKRDDDRRAVHAHIAYHDARDLESIDRQITDGRQLQHPAGTFGQRYG